MMNSLFSTVLVALMAQQALGHAGPAPVNWKRDMHAVRDDVQARCGEELLARRDLREEQMMKKRSLTYTPGRRSTNDSTALLTPEVTQGPYHVLSEIVRQNMTETQPGVPLEMNVEFFDISTCQPVQVWVDAWHANATGYYSGYEASTGGSSDGTFGGGSGGGDGGDASMSGMPDSSSMTGAPGASGSSSSEAAASTSYGPYDGADAASAASMLNTETTDTDTFLRGTWQSDENGSWTMYSVMPGWYTGRAVHFHIKVYPEGSIASNGTFVPAGSAVHTGQIFFDADTMAQVAATDIYAANSIAYEDSTSNTADQWYPYQASNGYDADASIVWTGSDITDGLIGTISVGLNLSYASPELSTQYQTFDVDSYLASSMLPFASASGAAAAEPSSTDAEDCDDSESDASVDVNAGLDVSL